MILTDFYHPLVKAKAQELTKGCVTQKEKIRAVFYYVRDGVKFGSPLAADLVKASETIYFKVLLTQDFKVFKQKNVFKIKN